MDICGIELKSPSEERRSSEDAVYRVNPKVMGGSRSSWQLVWLIGDGDRNARLRA